MVEDAEDLLGQLILGDAVVIVQSGLGTPTDVEGGVDVGLGPVHELAELAPVVHRFKVHDLHGGTGDDEAVVILVLDLVEGGIEGL